MSDPSDDAPDPATLSTVRLVRALVILLTATMIGGVIVIVALLVTRLPDGSVPLPSEIVLPDGTAPVAFTRGPDWMAVATADAILIYDLRGTLVQTVPIGTR